MTVGAGFVVDAVPLAPPRVSLLTSADVITTNDGERWANGMEWWPEACTPPVFPYWWVCGIPTEAPQFRFEGGGLGGSADVGTGANGSPDTTKVVPSPEAIINYQPYDVWVGVTCGNQPRPAGEDEARARRALAAFEPSLIEAELWTGRIAQAAGFVNDYFENTPTQLNSGADTPYVTALAELEQALAECQPGQVSMIHAQPRTVTVWIQNGLVTPEANGRRLRTALGTIVVPGGGYPGTGEDLVSATVASSYAYGTGLVRVWLGPVQIIEDYDHSVNTAILRAERSVAAVMDECCLVSVQVDLNTAL